MELWSFVNYFLINYVFPGENKPVSCFFNVYSLSFFVCVCVHVYVNWVPATVLITFHMLSDFVKFQ